MLNCNHQLPLTVSAFIFGHFLIQIINGATYYDVSLKECRKFGKNENNLKCLSYIPTEGGAGKCEVTSADDSTNQCDSDPCENTAVCTDSRRDSEGNCLYPMGGPTCEDLICEECYRKDDLVVFMDTTIPSMTWMESYEYCESRGLTLFMDKSWTTHGFIFGVLSEHINDRNANIAFWVGMNRTSLEAEFMYVDGTPLKKLFTNWAPHRPQQDLCVNVANTETFLWRWDDDDCRGAYGWVYYPLCQNTYPFLKK